MINEYETLYINNELLPKHLNLKQNLIPNAAKNNTINGTLYVQYFNNRRTWEVSWSLLTREEVQQILDLYYSQFATAIPLTLNIPGVQLTVYVYMEVSPDDIKYNGQYSNEFSVALEEIYAIS